MRQSIYNIFNKIDNTCILINSLFGSIDEIDDTVAEHLEENSLDKIPNDIKEQMYKRGYLTNLPIEKETEIAKNIIKKNFLNHAEQLGGNYIIILSYNCNFRCPYCFERQIQKKGLEYIKNQMTGKVVEKMLDFIEKNPPKTNSITLYGGEPLMTDNKNILRLLLEKISLKYKLKIISNGYEIGNFIDILSAENTTFIQISCDGSRRHHNQTRKSILGNSTYDVIMQNIQILINKGIKVNLRINCTKDNIADLHILHEELKHNSFYENNLFSISYSPIIDFSNNVEKNEIEMKHFIDTINSFNKMSKANNCIEGGYIHYHLRTKFQKSLNLHQPLQNQPVACNSYVNSYILDPFGKIYPCWDVTDDPEHCIGTFYPEITVNQTNLEKWRNREKIIFEKCIKCPYVFYCGGGCAVKAKLRKGDLNDVDCDTFPYIFKSHFACVY